jgi:uncharacterized phage protein (TIGR01671 family)
MEKKMREIKFRILVNGELKYNPCLKFYDGEIQYMDGFNNWEYISPENVMQYTGLKDKNGKEIYEGGVTLHPSGRKYPVEIPAVFELLWTGEISKVEVVGNVFCEAEKEN